VLHSRHGQKIFSLLQNVQTGSEDHPDCYSVGTKGLFPNCRKQLGHEVITQTHLVPSLKMKTAILLLPFYTFIVWTGQLYFNIYSIEHFHLNKPFPVSEYLCQHLKYQCQFFECGLSFERTKGICVIQKLAKNLQVVI
jgi:hypothetical protein